MLNLANFAKSLLYIFLKIGFRNIENSRSAMSFTADDLFYVNETGLRVSIRLDTLFSCFGQGFHLLSLDFNNLVGIEEILRVLNFSTDFSSGLPSANCT